MEPVYIYRHRPRIDFRPTARGFYEIGRAVSSFIKPRPWAALLLCLVILIGVIYCFASSTVTVYIDGEPVHTYRTFSRNVAEVLDELDLQLHPKDLIMPAQTSILRSNTSIEILKAFPVFIIADNSISEVWTAPVPIEDLLSETGYVLGPYDRVEPDGLCGQLTPMAQLKIVRVEKHYEKEMLAIPFEDVTRGNPALDRGLSNIISEGRNGSREDLVEITFEDGVEVSRNVIESVVLEVPVDRVLEVGENTSLVRDGLAMQFDRVLFMKATSYCSGMPGSGCPLNSRGHPSCTGPYANGFTYTGKRAIQGLGTVNSPRIIAVDPRVIPLGSMVYIEEIPGIGRIGFARAEDIGGAIKGNIIDILYDHHSDVARFGVRHGVKVYVLTSY